MSKSNKLQVRRDGEGFTYCQGSAHTHNLNILSQTKQFGGQELKQIASVAVIYHVALIQDDSLELGDGTVIDGCVDQGICLVC